jgi:hypothetical protein
VRVRAGRVRARGELGVCVCVRAQRGIRASLRQRRRRRRDVRGAAAHTSRPAAPTMSSTTPSKPASLFGAGADMASPFQSTSSTFSFAPAASFGKARDEDEDEGDDGGDGCVGVRRGGGCAN